jgi:SAM-dependent methyltransferase
LPKIGGMDRTAWLAERRAATRADYDAEAADYDELDYPREAQEAWVARLLALCPPGALVLDAPCGTGRYFAQVRAAGARICGIDQSPGMLEQARSKGLAEQLELVGLQELAFDAQFDAVLTIDAMENVPPEDWPLVLANLRRAAKPGGRLYLTVEENGDAAGVDAAFDELVARGLPALRGEVVEGDVASYHFYPDRERVRAWMVGAGLEVTDEAYLHARDEWGYRHFLLRRPADA